MPDYVVGEQVGSETSAVLDRAKLCYNIPYMGICIRTQPLRGKGLMALDVAAGNWQ